MDDRFRLERSSTASTWLPLPTLLQQAMESLLLTMVCLSPWLFGGVDPTVELWLTAGVACLAVAASVRMLLPGTTGSIRCPVLLCLAGLLLLGVGQLTPLPQGVIQRISPTTAQLYQRLLPQQVEQLTTDQAPRTTATPPGSTLSLYPQASRSFLARLFALVLLFAVVRTQIATPGSLRRLAIAAAVNGTLLALLGIVQFFSTEQHGVIYWRYESAGAAFGPFVNRNHFAFYINICLGLTLGLLLARSAAAPESMTHRRWVEPWRSAYPGQRLLQDPLSLWLVLAVALMLSSVVFCLSRGGVIAWLGAAATSAAALGARKGRGWSSGGLLLALAGAAGLLAWFGLEPIEARLATLWHTETYAAGRGYLLAQAPEIIRGFPLWGTGYGTFQYVEPLYLHTPGDVGTIYQHAHNDYLEDVIEGGLSRLALRLIICGLLIRYAWRAVRDAASPAAAGLAAGALFSVMTVIIHSFVEFGLFVPAIALLMATLAAQVTRLGQDTTRGAEHTATVRGAADAAAVRGDAAGSPAVLLMLPLATTVGWLMVGHGQRAVEVDDLRREARYARRDALAGVASRGAEIAPLLEAVELRPEDARLRMLLADALLETHTERLRVETPTGDRAAALREHLLLAGLEEARLARDLAPLLPAPHARLAHYQNVFFAAEPPQAYLDRIKLLAPADPQLWYFCGVRESSEGDWDQACRSWRRSLQLSDHYLGRILQAGAAHLEPEEIAERILPAEPVVLLAAADALYPAADQPARRVPVLQRLLRCFDDPSRSFTPLQLHAKAVAHRELEQPELAIDAYRAALAAQSQQVSWRHELAELYHQQGQYAASRREAEVVLARDPGHAAAIQLRDQAARLLAEQQLQNFSLETESPDQRATAP